MHLKAIVLIGCAAFLSGCANLNSIYRTHGVRTGEIVLSDAKQRAILTNYESVPIAATYDPATKKTTYSKKLGTLTRYCAEPSPDVFSVLSSSLAATASYSQSGTEREAALKLATQISESGSTIQRTQTIQTLREMMYRLCERYINGAVTKEAFEAQAARDHRIIVSILAIEQLTNAVRPEPVILKASASAQAGADHTAINTELAKARDTKAEAERDLETKKGELEAAKAALAASQQSPSNTPQTPPPASGEEGDADDTPAEGAANGSSENPRSSGGEPAPGKPSTEELQAVVDNTQSEVTLAEQKVADADKLIEKLEKLRDNPSPIEVAGIAGGKFGGTDFAPPAVTKQVADAVSAIVKQNIDFNETEIKCVTLLGKTGNENGVNTFCQTVLMEIAVKKFEQTARASGFTAAEIADGKKELLQEFIKDF